MLIHKGRRMNVTGCSALSTQVKEGNLMRISLLVPCIPHIYIYCSASHIYYLHQNCTVHLDLKPQNIWLDEKKVPKIHDFCGSRHLEEKQSKVITRDIGTPGYMAPELKMPAVITLKADIYSLGVVITDRADGIFHSKECTQKMG